MNSTVSIEHAKQFTVCPTREIWNPIGLPQKLQ
jgi:hypothetical protein